jgi:hypothetical protein
MFLILKRRIVRVLGGIFLKRGLPGERGNPKHLEKCC